MAATAQEGVLGLRPHTYWTAAVVMTGEMGAPVVSERARIVFATGGERMVFHRAEETDLATAEAMIVEVRAATTANAAREIAALAAAMAREGIAVRRAVTAASVGKLPTRLEDILKSHTRMHAAEGNFYRDVVADACAAAGLAVERVVEREIAALLGDALAADPASLQARLKAMGRALGPPWTEDYRLAAEAAWLHLKQ